MAKPQGRLRKTHLVEQPALTAYVRSDALPGYAARIPSLVRIHTIAIELVELVELGDRQQFHRSVVSITNATAMEPPTATA